MILNQIRNHAPISRTTIVSNTNLTHAAVSRSVAVLLKNDIVKESPLSDEKGPRRKRGLILNPEYGCCLAVGYTAFGLEGVIVDTAYQALVTSERKVPLNSMTQEQVIQQIKNFTEELRQKIPPNHTDCIGLAVIDPGIIDIENGVSLFSSTLNDWKNVPVKDILENHFNLPVMLFNNSNATITAIDRLENPTLSPNLMYVQYGRGIGSSLKLEGKYIFGHADLAGELGHIRVTAEPVPCHCGGIGCLEAMAALPALARNTSRMLLDNSVSSLKGTENLSGIDVLKAAAEGDRLATHVVEEAYTYLGQVVASVVNVVNPELLIFDHLVGLAGKNCVETLIRSLRKDIMEPHAKTLQIRISEQESHLNAMGGAFAILDYCLEK
ncbi:MAG: ROK family protein [Planctomycetes bacterium]|nr:ROK family protein [Planctomycetota bacterium]